MDSQAHMGSQPANKDSLGKKHKVMICLDIHADFSVFALCWHLQHPYLSDVTAAACDRPWLTHLSLQGLSPIC